MATNRLRLYTLSFKQAAGWDQFTGFTVLAVSADRARDLIRPVLSSYEDQRAEDFRAKFECNTDATRERIVRSSFRNG